MLQPTVLHISFFPSLLVLLSALTDPQKAKKMYLHFKRFQAPSCFLPAQSGVCFKTPQLSQLQREFCKA